MDTSAIYGLESQGRALCSFPNEMDSIRFYAGTLSPRAEGQIHQIDFEEDTNQITRKIYKPKIGEIWQLQVSPTGQCMGICYNEVTEGSSRLRCGIWNIPTDSYDPDEDRATPVKLPPESGALRNFDWHPTRHGVLAIACEDALSMWDLQDGQLKMKATAAFRNIYSCRFNPHLDGNQCAYVSAGSVSGIDVRVMKEAWKIQKAHKFQIRDLDFNPNKQYYLATCGDDCAVRFWDVRNPNIPLKELECHSHWIWQVRFNSFHDQLVLTSGSDFRVFLHALPSVSSEPHGRAILSDSEEEERASTAVLEEGILATYEEHEDAVYGVEWSSYDPWIFASLSYDGRLVINRVPKAHKYKLLL